jgi:hypothetical protein
VMRQVAHSSVPMAALMHSGLCPVHRGFIAIGRSPRADGAGPFAIPNPNEGAPDPSHLGIGDSPDLTKPVTEKRYFRSVPANAHVAANHSELLCGQDRSRSRARIPWCWIQGNQSSYVLRSAEPAARPR